MNAPAAASARIGPDAALCVPITVVGELFRGAQKSGRVAANLRRVENFSTGVKILAHDMETARRYGLIQHVLRLKGKPLTQNDAWIAATAMRFDLPLVTRDKHFDYVDGLKIVAW